MAALLFDLDNSFKDLSSSVKNFKSGLKDLDGSFNNITKASDATSKSLTAGKQALEKFAAAGKVVGGVAFGLLAVADAGSKLAAIAQVGDAAYKSWVKFKGVESSLNFSTAITGSDKLAKNFEMLGQISDNVFNRITLAQQALFDPKGFAEFSGGAVRAFADVEQAAYRLATVTTSANEKSIDKIKSNIEATRQLQKATNDALGTVELLNTQYDIASAGFTSKKDNLNVGKASVNLAEAGFGDVGGATNAVVRALRALSDTSEDAEKRAAQLFETTRVGLLTLNQLTPEVGTLAVSSKTLGLNFSEVAGALAGLTTQGISASEASTRLQAFFSEVVQGSDKANQYLAQFRDEAGKPIQLNASALKEKGIGGVVADLKKATGGSQSALQQIFGRQESVEAVQLLSNLGQDTLKEYEGRIEGSTPGRLDEEAKNKQKTLSGAFQKGANESQKQIEDFGKGLAPTILDDITNTNEVIGSLLTTTSEGVGKLTGTFTGLGTKISAIGSFIGAAFSATIPFAMFAVIGKGFTVLSGQFKKLQKEGESPWKTIERMALTFVAKVEDRIVSMVSNIKKKLDEVKQEIRQGIDDAQNAPIQTDLFGNNTLVTAAKAKDPVTTVEAKVQEIQNSGAYQLQLIDPSDVFAKAKQDTIASMYAIKNSVSTATDSIRAKLIDGSKTAKSTLEKGGQEAKTRLIEGAKNVKDAVGKDNLSKLTAVKAQINDTISSAQGSLSSMFSKFGQGTRGKQISGSLAGAGEFFNVGKFTDPLKNAGTGLTSFGAKASSVVSGGVKNLVPMLGAAGKYLLGIGIAGGAAAIGFSVVSGWSNALFSTLNKKSIPALQDMRESLLDLKNVQGLDKILASLDPVAGSLDSASYSMNVLNESMYRGSKLWNDLTGSSFVFFNSVLPELDKADAAIEKSLNTKLASFKEGSFGAVSSGAKTAEYKVSKGIALTQDDTKALEDENADFTKQAQARVALQRQKIKEGEGKFSVQQMELEKSKLAALEQQTKEQIKQLDLQVKQIKLREAVNKLKTVDTSIPLQLQVSEQNESAISNQIQDIKDKFNKGLAGTLDSPEAFDKLSTDVSNALSSIQTQIELDPASATKLRDDLVKSIPDFDKLIFSNPQLRAKAAELNKAVSDSNIKNAQQEETANVSVFSQAVSSGSTSTPLIAAKVEAQITSINQQAKVLSNELARPETPLARQKEILAQIEQLEAQRLQLNIEQRVNAELGGRKQTLTLAEQLLDVDKTRINLFNQESQFASLAVTSAQAKLDAATKELAVKKEQIAIAAKEKTIGKEEIGKALLGRVDRLKSQEVKIAGGSSAVDIRKSIATKQKGLDDQAATNIKAVQADTDRKIAELKNTPIKFSKDEVAKLQAAGANIADEAGNLRSGVDVTKIQKDLAAKANLNRNFGDDDRAQVQEESIGILIDKRFQRASELAKITGSGKSQISSITTQTAADKQRLERLGDKQIGSLIDTQAIRNKAEAAIGSGKSNKDTTDKSRVTSDEINFAKLTEELANKFGSLNEQIASNEAAINKEFASREKLIKRGELLSDSFSQIAQGTTIVANSIASSSLQLSAVKSANKEGKLQAQADKEVANITSKLATLAENAAIAQAAADAAKAQNASPDIQANLNAQAKSATDLSKQANSEGAEDIKFVKTKTALDKIAAGLETAAASVKKEFAERTRLIEISEGLSGAFSSLASTASSLFQNSSLGSIFNRVAAEISAGGGKIEKEYAEQQRILNERNKALREAVTKAEESGADKNTVASLKEAVDLDTKQKPVEEAYLKQKRVLDTLNEKLGVMSAKVAEVTDALNKQGSLVKDKLDFEQRRTDNNAAFNKSGRNLQGSLLGAFGKNNPFAELLQKRIDFKQAGEDAIVQKSKNVTEAKKELIDLTIQKQQLALEQQSYENAITQTQLLSDMVSLQKGGDASFSNSADVQGRLKQLPSLIESSRKVAEQRLSFVNERMSYIPKELEQRNRVVDMDTQGRKLGIATQNGVLDPSMLPELRQVLGETQTSLKSFKPSDISAGSLNDSAFAKELQALQTMSADLQSTSQRTASAATVKPNQQPVTSINAPVQVTLTVTGAEANQFNKNTEQNLKQYIGQQVQTAMNQLSRQLVTASRR